MSNVGVRFERTPTTYSTTLLLMSACRQNTFQHVAFVKKNPPVSSDQVKSSSQQTLSFARENFPVHDALKARAMGWGDLSPHERHRLLHQNISCPRRD